MGYENKDSRFDSVYSKKVKAGRRRTYFFDVRETKGTDYYVTITESTRKFEDDSYTRHKIFLYKEDFNRFVESLTDVVDHVKNELMPDYDYDEFARRNAEREAEYLLEKEAERNAELTPSERKEQEQNTLERSNLEADKPKRSTRERIKNIRNKPESVENAENNNAENNNIEDEDEVSPW